MTSGVPPRIGPYEILRQIGRGGMGVVYLARDTTLDRDVAIKCLPDELAEDADRLARFQREAKLLASINHPNVATIHGLEEADGKRYLILEYVEGETLEQRLSHGAIPVIEALPIAVQIAHAIEAAHDKGIIHRDLKPANIKFASADDGDDEVKVLDFGLAKAVDDHPSSASRMADSPTITPTQSPTMPGVVLGTAGYLSPEQARGRPVDTRTDIFSFGCVLYEMLTGEIVFGGETLADSIGATLHKDVDFGKLPADTPPLVLHVLRRCLQRDRKNRLRDIGDARLDLELAQRPEEQLDTGVPAVPPRTRRRLVVEAGWIALVVLLVGLFVGLRLGRSSTGAVVQFSIEPPPGTRIRHSGDLAGPAVVSPDGSMVAFAASAPGEAQRLWVRHLDDPQAREIDGTDGALFPFWSPDSRSIGFFTIGKLRWVDLTTETITTVCDAVEARGGAWTTDGQILFSPNFSSPIYVVDPSGGTPRAVTQVDSTLHTSDRWPAALPDGQRFLYLALDFDPAMRHERAIYIGSLDGTPARMLLRCEFGASYVSEWLLFVRDGVLLASRVDLDEARLTGDLRVVARLVAADLSTWHCQFSASAGGVLVFNRISAPVDASNNERSRRALAGNFEGDMVTAFDRGGRPETHYAEGVPHTAMSLSPDGYTMALAVQTEDGTLDLWLYPTAFEPEPENLVNPNNLTEATTAVMTPKPRRLTFLDGSESRQVWSPDSDEIAFVWRGSGVEKPGIYRKRIGGGTEELVAAHDSDDEQDIMYPEEWTRDGKYLVVVRGTWLPSEFNDILALPLDGGELIPLVQSPELDWMPRVSPDGRWLAYSSRQSGTVEVYVIPFAPAWPDGDRGRQWQVSMSGGRDPRWSSDGADLFYISSSGSLMVAEVELAGDSFGFDSPTLLFQSPYDTGSSYEVFPVSDLSHQFLFSDTRQPSDAPIAVILNWQRLLDD